MNALDALGRLLAMRRSVITTREAAVRLGVSTSRASQLLGGLEKAGLAIRLRHGLWTFDKDIDPWRIPPYLSAPFPAYVSFWSALARHGMIQQVPRQVFVASLARTRRISTKIASYSIHHLTPQLFGGYLRSENEVYVATPEKALFDTVYLRAPGGGVALPELELPTGFQKRKVAQWVARIHRPRLRTIASRDLERILS